MYWYTRDVGAATLTRFAMVVGMAAGRGYGNSNHPHIRTITTMSPVPAAAAIA